MYNTGTCTVSECHKSVLISSLHGDSQSHSHLYMYVHFVHLHVLYVHVHVHVTCRHKLRARVPFRIGKKAKEFKKVRHEATGTETGFLCLNSCS